MAEANSVYSGYNKQLSLLNMAYNECVVTEAYVAERTLIHLNREGCPDGSSYDMTRVTTPIGYSIYFAGEPDTSNVIGVYDAKDYVCEENLLDEITSLDEVGLSYDTIQSLPVDYSRNGNTKNIVNDAMMEERLQRLGYL
ncbi:MAG: hypothetical protein KKF44_09080 [Nanoarchaeota archaeon]|nr:hypothetical protein [Nanoarchaeota archaeon]